MNKRRNNPKNIDNKYEAGAYIVDLFFSFLKKHWWKVVILILSFAAIIIPFIWIDLSGLAGMFK